MSFTVQNALASAAPGSRIKGHISVGTMASGAPIAIAYTAVKGRHEGPCLWVNGQVHGVETNGVLASLDFINGIDPAQLNGSVVVTASANPLALDARRKAAPQDDNDLDQTFPGRATGFVSERLAAVFFAEVKACANVLINMHSNAPTFDAKPYGVYKRHPLELVPERVLLGYLAEFHPSVCCLMSVEPGKGELLGNIPGALDYQLLGLGIPAFMIELGEGSRAQADFIAQAVTGMRGVARQMGLLPADASTKAPTTLRKVTRRGHVTFDHGGLFRSTRHPGEVIRAGEPLGEVMNLHGEIVQKMVPASDVIVICIRRDPVVHTGDRFVYVAQEWQEIELN